MKIEIIFYWKILLEPTKRKKFEFNVSPTSFNDGNKIQADEWDQLT